MPQEINDYDYEVVLFVDGEEVDNDNSFRVSLTEAIFKDDASKLEFMNQLEKKVREDIAECGEDDTEDEEDEEDED